MCLSSGDSSITLLYIQVECNYELTFACMYIKLEAFTRFKFCVDYDCSYVVLAVVQTLQILRESVY